MILLLLNYILNVADSARFYICVFVIINKIIKLLLTIYIFGLYYDTHIKRSIQMQKRKKWFKSPLMTHVYTFVLGGVLAWCLTNNAKQKRLEDREDNALRTFHTEYVDPVTGERITAETFNPEAMNRAYFDPASIPAINWTNYSNQKASEVFGEIVAREMAMVIDSINYGLTTPGKAFHLDYNYCNKAATTAIQRAQNRSGLIKKGKVNLFDRKQGSNEALYNGDSFVSYFNDQYGEKVQGAVIENPEVADFANIGTGSIVRFPGHTKVFMGIGFVDASGRVFVPDPHGFPVIASGYNDVFGYFTGGECTVVDLSKIVYYKLQNERGRHTR